VIADILDGLKLDSRALLEQAQTDDTKSRLRTQNEQAAKLGVFGAPTFIAADGELFWGNDRLEAALRWASK